MIYRQFDPADAMRMLRCDQTELIALALHLLDHCHQACDGLELALISGEWRGVNAVLHKIRSGCAVLRAEPACDLAREMEHKMRHQVIHRRGRTTNPKKARQPCFGMARARLRNPKQGRNPRRTALFGFRRRAVQYVLIV